MAKLPFRPSQPPTLEQRRAAALDQIRVRVADRMAAALQSGSGEETRRAIAEIETLVDGNLVRLEEITQRQRESGMMIPLIACKKGCSHCCTVRVTASVPEAMRVAEHLRATLSTPELATFLETAKAYLARFEGLDSQARMVEMVPCPMLDTEGACSIHTIRPIACRRHHSLDVEACKRAAKDPGRLGVPQNLEHATVTQPVVDGVDQGTLRARRQPTRIELFAALVLALETDAEARWLNGEDAFAPAADPEFRRITGG